MSRHRRGEDPAAERSAAPVPQSPPEAEDGPAARSGLGAVLHEEEFSVADAIGGRRGIIESVLPTLLFVVIFVATGAVALAAGAAVAAVVVMLVVRLVQRQSPSTVIGGLLGVALGAILAVRSGEG